MDQEAIYVTAGSIVFAGLLMFFIFRGVKKRPLTLLSEIVEDKKNPGLYHIFGAVTFMPDDSPSFEKYQHFLLNTADLKVIKGLEQRGSDFDISSPFAARCLEHMKIISGRDLLFKQNVEDDSEDYDEDAEERAEEKNKVRIVKHERDESDTSTPKVIKGNVIEVFNTSFGERDRFALKVTLDNMSFSIPKVKGMPDVNKIIWRKNNQRLFIFYNRMVMMKFGVGMLVVDTNSGSVLSDDYFRQNLK
ncbi:hypothetical protein BH11BAC7_BH11BAC7_01270 [soil metagenome]